MATEVKQRNNKIFVIIGVVVAAAAFLGSLYLSQRNSGSSSTAGGGSNAPAVRVVVATAVIPKGTKIVDTQVAVKDLPADQVPVGAPSDTTGLVGKYTSLDIQPNSVFQVSWVYGDVNSANAAIAVTPPLDIHKGFVAVTMPVAGTGVQFTQDSVSVGNFIQNDDHIDIIVDAGNGSTRYALQDIRVLHVGGNAPPAAAGAAVPVPTVFIVELNRAQAELVTYLTTNRGPQTILRYVLRSRDDYGKTSGSNYVDTTDPGVKQVADPPVDPNSFGRLFPAK